MAKLIVEVTRNLRGARAYSTSLSQVILVYLHPFRRNLLFNSQKSPKITKTFYF